MQVKGDGWDSEFTIASRQGCSSLISSFGSNQLYRDGQEP